MAIIQISKIQQRSGNLVDLPQLDQGEFGWASDASRLFIGKTATGGNIENVEVLTSYSNINFSQLEGSVGNLDITAASVANGQVLTYDGSNWVNRGGSAGGLINLGDASNVKITGGAIDYILSTDGYGNLSWTPKGTLYTTIVNLTNNVTGNIITMQVANTTAYTNKQAVTISGATISNSGASGNINGATFYVKLDANFTASSSVTGSGNVTLYTDLGLTTTANGAGLATYTANSGIATAVINSGGGTGAAAGSNTSVQFNQAGIISGDSNLVYNYSGSLSLSLSAGNINSNNLNATNKVVASTLTSNVATGTAPLIVTSTTQVANMNVASSGTSVTVTSAAQPNITSVGTLTTLAVTGNANVGNLGTGGLIVATGNVTGGNIVTGGVLSVTGNANVGNLGTAGLVVATGNVTGGNLVTGGVLSVTGNANVGNLGTATAIITTGNITTINSGLLQNGNSNVSITANGNVTLYVNGNATARLTATSTGIVANGTISVSGNANVGNLGTGGLIVATGNVTGGNLVTGGVLSVTGNANVGNLGTAQVLASANITTPQFISNVATGTAPLVVTSTTQVANLSVATAGSATTAGTVTTNAQPNITSTGTLTSLAVTGNITNGNVTGGNLVSANYFTGVLTTAAQPNVTSVSTSFTNLTFANAQTISGNNMTLTAGANTNLGTITGNWSLSSGSRLTATYADLAEYYEADKPYEPGTVVEFGGDKEVTIAEDGTTRVAGVVSTNPAYVMNSQCQGEHIVAIALQGRVPCKIRGTVRKGDMLVSGGEGYARPMIHPYIGSVIGKALENFEGEGVIEVAVGRL